MLRATSGGLVPGGCIYTTDIDPESYTYALQVGPMPDGCGG